MTPRAADTPVTVLPRSSAGAAPAPTEDRLAGELRLLTLRLGLALAEAVRDVPKEPLAAFRGVVVSDEEVLRSLGELEDRWLNAPAPDPPPPADPWRRQQAEALERRLDARVREGADDPLSRLGRRLGLSVWEQRCLVVALAPELDERFERIFAYLQDDSTRRAPGVGLILRLLGAEPGEAAGGLRAFVEDAKVRRHQLIHLFDRPAGEPGALLSKGVRLDARAVCHLLGLPHAGLAPPPTGAREQVPARRWDDLVVPADTRAQLAELVAQVRQRPTVLGDWGFGARLSGGKGVHALFAGPPGTGKTLAAEVITADLGRRLWRIDLAQIVSKYIGETEKNVERVFRAAAADEVVLFFDEADALFGRRGEVKDSHDRYANQEVCHLLQQMEDYPGVALLATNLPRNLDEAFLRRLQFVVDFPFPDEGLRRRIWEVTFPAAAPLSPAVDLAALARAVRLSGGHIRNIALAAAYAAADRGEEIGMAHLWHAARREHQKVGQAWAPPDPGAKPEGRPPC
jgi:AAA+ superfamily predicted ATPase